MDYTRLTVSDLISQASSGSLDIRDFYSRLFKRLGELDRTYNIFVTLAESQALSQATPRTRHGSLAGLPLREGRRRPFRSPHHSLSLAGLLGSGGKGGRPGELSLAHRGLLFLDELPEFNRAVLEALREPLEEGSYVLSRGAGSLRWPARFQLAAAMNPCPCGQRLRGSEHCRCTPGQRRRYFGRISGPLLDRVDLVLHVPRRRRLREAEGRPGEAVRRVATARRRLRESPPALPPGEQRWLDEQLERLFSSFRLRFKIRKLARSLAALDGSERVTRPQMLEALDLGLESRLEILTEMGEGEPP